MQQKRKIKIIKKGADKFKQNKNIHKISSKRCIEYWTYRGFTELEAKEKVSKHQATFTLKKCIEKYGDVEGKNIWENRQIKWKKTLDEKPIVEKNEINRKKATKINYRTLWSKDLKDDGMLYLLKIYNKNEEFYKIGITSRSIHSRFGGNKIGNYNYDVIDTIQDNINKVFLLEQKIIKNNKHISYTPQEKFEGWTECFYEKPIINCK